MSRGIGAGFDQDVLVCAGDVQGEDFLEREKPVADFSLIDRPCKFELARGVVAQNNGLVEVALNVSDHIFEWYLAILQSPRNPLSRFGLGGGDRSASSMFVIGDRLAFHQPSRFPVTPYLFERREIDITQCSVGCNFGG